MQAVCNHWILTEDEPGPYTASESHLQLSPQPHSSTTLGLLHQLHAFLRSEKDSLVKDEPGTQPVIPPVHYTPNDTKQRL
jgi:hypothetical protein